MLLAKTMFYCFYILKYIKLIYQSGEVCYRGRHMYYLQHLSQAGENQSSRVNCFNLAVVDQPILDILTNNEVS